MQLIALLTMLIDHIGIVFFPDDQVWRLIGRLSFPLYAYGIVVGLRYTRSRIRYVKRLAVIGAAAQLPYMLAFDMWRINVIGTFIAVIGVLWVVEKYKNIPVAIGTVCISALLLDVGNFDYGSYALFLILIYRYVSLHWTVSIHLLLNVVYVFYQSWILQLASVFSTLLLVYGPNVLEAINKIKLPRWLWLSFYPAHLALLFLLELII